MSIDSEGPRMGFGVTILFYLAIGAGVAVAVYLAGGGLAAGSRGFRTGSAVVFWPFFLPILLSRPRLTEEPARSAAPPPADEMAAAIAQVEAELDAAFSSLDGWAEDVLAREAERIRELRAVWTAQAGRIREMDRLLSQTPDQAADAGEATGHQGRRLRSEQARLANLARLRQVRDRAHDDLMATLAWVRELVSMIHLAKFTGAPATRAEELVAQVAAAVEGVSAVTWQEDPAGSSADHPQPDSILL
jgi:hypothetical protein